MSAIVERFKSQSSSTSRSGSGRAVPVYDGRSWPVIKCGAVYVTDADKTKHVTKNIVDQAKSSNEKKKRSSKYSLAVGSSFGHVHAFLKDSDHVLKALDETKAEDKCLMLIRKPKSASKQMLKAHSWANLSAPDMHLRRPDGSMKPNPNPQSRHTTRPSNNLTLPRDQNRKWSSTNDIQPRKALVNHSSSFKELSTVIEQQPEVTRSDDSSWQQDETNGNSLSYSYPSEHYPNLKSFGRAVSSVDLRHTAPEINNNSNNNRMGGAFTKSQDKHRPKGPPPPVPNKSFKNIPTQQSESTKPPQVYRVDNDPRKNGSHPDVIPNVKDSSTLPNDRPSANVQISHSKSDSGFFSDEMYDYGFKQELDMNNGSHMTSSPRSEKGKLKGNGRYSNTKQTNGNTQQVQNTRQRMEPEPQKYDNRSSAVQKGNTEVPRQQTDNRNRRRSDKNDPSLNKSKEGYRSDTNVSMNKENNNRPDLRNNHPRNEKVNPHRHPSSPYYDNRSHDNPTGARNIKDSVHLRPKSDYTKQRSEETGQNPSRPSPAKDDHVMRAYSMGDLSAGCAFSLVGQKRNETMEDIDNVGLTGTQLAEHFRKYRKIKQESKHGSLPFRGKSTDDNDVRGRLDEIQYSQPPSFQNTTQKAMHYGSLQHLPLSADNYKSDHRQVMPTKFREKTPMKPRRSLPQVPGDVDEKKNKLSEVVKSRISASSRSNSSPSSGGSNRASEVRVGGVSATPSDREVSVLLGGNQSDIVWVKPQSKKPVCNNSTLESDHGHILPPDGQYGSSYQSLGASDSYSRQTQNTSGYIMPSGGRLSESGQTTLTSQSTVDSGYITNDPDQDPLSTSNYAKTVKQSAQNLYSSNKMFKPSKGDHSQMIVHNTQKGGNSQAPRDRMLNSKQAKDTHTRNWLENHPGSYMSDYLKMGLNVNDGKKHGHIDNTDTNNNKDIKHIEKQVTELDLTDHQRPKQHASKSHGLMHHFSDPSGKESEKAFSGDMGNFKHKGMSISMSQGLNMIEKNSRGSSGSFLSKSQPKFTGSLKDLLGANKQIVPIEALRGDNSQLAATLPGNWKYQHKPETSLKLLGKPSLFQILQNYNLYAVRMKIPDGFNMLDHIRMIECEVVLPSLWLHNPESQLATPKGNYAKIGGPFSAFRPVSNQNCQIHSVSMVTVMELSEQLSEMFETGVILKGDLVVEVNERLMIGESLSSLNGLLDGCHGEVLWTIARDRARENQLNRTRGTSTPTTEEFRKMEHTVNELTRELRKKDRTLKQLNALLPWKQTNGKEGADGKEQDTYICTLSEDEFIV